MKITAQVKKFNIVFAFYLMLFIASAIFGNKIITTSWGVFSAASLISPIWYVLNDVILEVYGYFTARHAFAVVLVVAFTLGLMCSVLIQIPSPTNLAANSAYQWVFGNLLKTISCQWLGISLAWWLSAKLFMRWQRLWQRKYFALRSCVASALMLCLFSMLSIFPTIYGRYPLTEVVSIITWSCVLKIMGVIIFSHLSILLIYYLQPKTQLNTNELRELLESP